MPMPGQYGDPRARALMGPGPMAPPASGGIVPPHMRFGGGLPPAPAQPGPMGPGSVGPGPMVPPPGMGGQIPATPMGPAPMGPRPGMGGHMMRR